MSKGTLLFVAEAVGLGTLIGYVLKKIKNTSDFKVPDNEEEPVYKESNLEDIDDIEAVCEPTDENAIERNKMQQELLNLKRFRASYIQSLDDTQLTILYNLACK